MSNTNTDGKDASYFMPKSGRSSVPPNSKNVK